MTNIKMDESTILRVKNEVDSLSNNLLFDIDKIISNLKYIDFVYKTNSLVAVETNSTIESLLDIRDSYFIQKSTFIKFLDDLILSYKDVDYQVCNKNLVNLKIPLINTNKFNKKQANSIVYDIDENGYVSLNFVHPELQKKIDELVKICKNRGINIKITETVRSVQRQDELYSKGRNTSGHIVTNAKGSSYSSNHQWGIAFDICINDRNNPYDAEKLKEVGMIGKSLGLEWGGDWKDFSDMPHFQLPDYGSNTDKLKSMYKDPADFYEKSWPKNVNMISKNKK